MNHLSFELPQAEKTRRRAMARTTLWEPQRTIFNQLLLTLYGLGVVASVVWLCWPLTR